MASVAAETTDRGILVAFWPKYGFRSNHRAPNKIFPGGIFPQTP